MTAEHRRLTYALLLSLLTHALLLALTFGDEGFWLPGFRLPWQDERTDASDLRLVLVPERLRSRPFVAPPKSRLTIAERALSAIGYRYGRCYAHCRPGGRASDPKPKYAPLTRM